MLNAFAALGNLVCNIRIRRISEVHSHKGTLILQNHTKKVIPQHL